LTDTTLASRALQHTVSQDGGSTPGTTGESSSGQCAAAHCRPRAVCNPATAAWSERTADWPSPERTADEPIPARSASQCSAVSVWGERSARWSIGSLRGTTAADSAVQSWLSAEHAFAVKWSHAHAPRALLAQLEFSGCFACNAAPCRPRTFFMQCSHGCPRTTQPQ